MLKTNVQKLDYLIKKLERKMKKADEEDKGFLFVRLSAEYQKAVRLRENIERASKENNEHEMPKINFVIGLDQDLI